MAGNLAAPLKGQEYQWIYGWFRCLALLGPNRVVDVVRVEDPTAGFFDDVTVTPIAGRRVAGRVRAGEAPRAAGRVFLLRDHAEVKRGGKRIPRPGCSTRPGTRGSSSARPTTR